MPSLKQIIRRTCRSYGLKIPQGMLKPDEAFVRNVAKTLTRDDVVIDLGAHVGMASTEFAHYAGKVYAFEPHPEIFRELKRRTLAYPRIKPLNIAASDEDGTAELFFDAHPDPKRFTEGSSLADNKSNLTYENSHKVETVRLSRFIRDLPTPVSLIKMDVEGLEYRLIDVLLDDEVMDRIGIVHVEDHCDRIETLVEHRDRVLARIEAAGLGHKFDFTWP